VVIVYGDTGGPAVIDAETNPVHVGIISFVSVHGCESGRPSEYTRIAHYTDWNIDNSEMSFTNIYDICL
jgi:secreted trypsin-like serine protease